MHHSRAIVALVSIMAFCALLSTSATATEPAASATVASGAGTVNAILIGEKKINITHGPIPALGWSGMTMDFRLADAVTLEGIEVGSKVTFRLRKAADGMYEIESLSLSKD
jgi:Cu/Ag efflux protein CusF